MTRAELCLGAFSATQRGRLLAALIRRKAGSRLTTIVDVGGGDGTVLFDLASDGVRVVCVDIDRPRMTLGATDARRRSLPVAFLEADATRLPIMTGSCDIAVLYEMIQTVREPARAIAEASRALRPGGWLIVTAPNVLSPFNILDDPHHHLPFVQQLPTPVAQRYVRAFRRRMPSLGDAFHFPRWSEFERYFAAAGLRMELESMLLLKLADPSSVLAGWKRPLARAMLGLGLDRELRSGALSPLRRAWDRRIARGWLLVGQKD